LGKKRDAGKTGKSAKKKRSLGKGGAKLGAIKKGKEQDDHTRQGNSNPVLEGNAGKSLRFGGESRGTNGSEGKQKKRRGK